MTPATLIPEAGAPAPAPPSSVVATDAALFPTRTPRRREVTLPDAGITVLVEALTPREYDDVNHAAVKTEGGEAKLDNRLWNARLIAIALRKPDGKRWAQGEAQWRPLAIRISTEWTIADVQHAAEAVADVSGISRKAREEAQAAAGKDSSGTATDD